MVAVRNLQTEIATFWRDEYDVSDDDLDLITGLMLEAGSPQALSVLVSTIITHRCQQERDAIALQARSGQIYQPKGHYEMGQALVFSRLEFALGRVVAVREGYNPKFGPFDVIRVSFEDGSAEREFASDFAYPHPLNCPAEELVLGKGPRMSDGELAQLFEQYVTPKLEATLEADEDFLFFDGRWFLRELVPDLRLEYLLNLAEAMIYEGGQPLAAHEMLPRLEIDVGATTEVQLFALNHALDEDERFDNVSIGEEPVWFLRSLEPEAAFHRPAVLNPAFRAVGGEWIGLTMLDPVEELGDELDSIEGALSHDVESVRFEVIFPHLYAGTMPATSQFLRMLPPVPSRHLPVTMIDARTGDRFDVWVLPHEHYVGGLDDWYKAVKMCVGGQVSVAPTEDPLTFTLSVVPARRRRSEWVRSASMVEGQVVVQMQKASVAVRCDRDMLLDVPDGEAIASFMVESEQAQISLRAVVQTAFEELAKLNDRGIVHVKALYSLANLIRRTGAVPVFAELTRRACYDPVGGGYWAYDPGLAGKTYHSPVEMRDRPLSQREGLVKDRVIEYQGT